MMFSKLVCACVLLPQCHTTALESEDVFKKGARVQITEEFQTIYPDGTGRTCIVEKGYKGNLQEFINNVWSVKLDKEEKPFEIPKDKMKLLNLLHEIPAANPEKIGNSDSYPSLAKIGSYQSKYNGVRVDKKVRALIEDSKLYSTLEVEIKEGEWQKYDDSNIEQMNHLNLSSLFAPRYIQIRRIKKELKRKLFCEPTTYKGKRYRLIKNQMVFPKSVHDKTHFLIRGSGCGKCMEKNGPPGCTCLNYNGLVVWVDRYEPELGSGEFDCIVETYRYTTQEHRIRVPIGCLVMVTEADVRSGKIYEFAKPRARKFLEDIAAIQEKRERPERSGMFLGYPEYNFKPAFSMFKKGARVQITEEFQTIYPDGTGRFNYTVPKGVKGNLQEFINKFKKGARVQITEEFQTIYPDGTGRYNCTVWKGVKGNLQEFINNEVWSVKLDNEEKPIEIPKDKMTLLEVWSVKIDKEEKPIEIPKDKMTLLRQSALTDQQIRVVPAILATALTRSYDNYSQKSTAISFRDFSRLVKAAGWDWCQQNTNSGFPNYGNIVGLWAFDHDGPEKKVTTKDDARTKLKKAYCLTSEENNELRRLAGKEWLKGRTFRTTLVCDKFDD